ncbi:hypothetical protein N7474_010287 [Penicillium riverlandense]|uniref:uncharacterized protein n=1 Tax=Penicillium riverlandense TaxID=1903569 RepID=UPI0025471D22|nr:uncharacterized protein N7474_010287 [Penicillium riverlandense]KAJ5806695.1 hypothetical protein N7474_010287 [Penicillium riverlandense]
MTLKVTDHVDHLLLYGDQTVEKLPAIRLLVEYSRTSVVIRRFLRDACDAVQIETTRLRPEERTNIKEFDCLLRLADDNARSDSPSEIVATVLMNVARLGELILYAEEDPSILGSMANPIHVLGFCTGEIPAAVAVAAHNTTELYQLSVEAVHIIFRFARDCWRRTVLADQTIGNWATTLVGVTPGEIQPLLNEFHRSQSIPDARQVNIGFASQGWLTLFGPPTTMPQLFTWSKELDQVCRVKTDAGGAVHMPNLPELDLDVILGSSPLLDTPITSKASFLSPYTCQPRAASTLGELIRSLIPEVTQKMLRLSDTIEETLRPLGRRPVRVTSVGYTPHLVSVQKTLQAKRIPFTVAEHTNQSSQPITSQRGGSNLIAIVGMAGRLPGSESVEEYWQSLLDQKRFIREIPRERFDLDKWYGASGKEKNAILNRTGAFLDRPGYFDNRLFNMSPREALQTDPLHRLLLTVSYEALENAGYSPDGTLATSSERIGTFYGQASDDWRDILFTQGIDIYYTSGACRAFAPGRVNYHFKWGGPSYSVDNACASSISTVSLACSALISRECDTALAGGGSILDSPAPFSGLSRGGFLSLNAGCETFHDDADGYVRGEGVGVVVLKRLEDALTENDNILGIIKGSARNYNKGASSITHPSQEGQQRLYHQILHQTATDPASIAYVEMHGTGTQAGDYVEMSSVLSTFANDRSKDNPLVVGAVKANIGHGEAAAGVSALIKVLMMLQEKKIPPQPDMPFKINHRFPDLAKMNVHIAGSDMKLRPSPTADGKLRVFLNSFDASGGNSCLLLEEAPDKLVKPEDPRTRHVIAFSARTASSLHANKKRCLEYLKRYPDARLADFGYTTTARRMHGPLRSAFTAETVEELVDLLKRDIASSVAPSKKGKDGGAGGSNVVYTFTGQGSQYAGMAQQLYKYSHAFRSRIESFQRIVEAQHLPNFVDLIVTDKLDLAGESPVRVQLAVCAVEIALAQLWTGWGLHPTMVMGHSLGEYAALCSSGVLTVSDTLYLVGRRATMMEKSLIANEYAMLAVANEANEVDKVLSAGSYGSCVIACLNSSKITVVSGTTSELETLQQTMRDQGTRSTLLQVPFGFHSKQLDPILDQYEECAQGVIFSAPKIPIASTLLGEVVQDEFIISPAYLRRQSREPVNFMGALLAAQGVGIVRDDTLFIEMGPDPICSGLVRATLGAAASSRILPTLRKGEDNWTTTTTTLAAIYQAGFRVNWPEYHKEYTDCLSLLQLPTYAFDEKDYWTPYPDPGQLVQTKIEQKDSPSAVPAVVGFPTTTLQRVTREIADQSKVSVTFESLTSEAHLFAAIQGHSVVGVKICSSAVFADMALSAARYAYERLRPGELKQSLLTIRCLDLHRAIVVMDKDPGQTIEIRVELISVSNVAQIFFRVRDAASAYDVGTCEIAYDENTTFRESISSTLFLVSSRIEALKANNAVGGGHRLLRPVIYQLFSNLVEYGEHYQGLDEVSLDANLRDGFGEIKMPTLPSVGRYLYDPFLLDATVHLAGFLVNCGLKYSNDIAFLSTGFDAWRLLKPLSPEGRYISYAHMEETADKSAVVGDVYVFDDANDLVCALTGVRFQRMKKTALSRILMSAAPMASRKTAGTRFAPEPVEFTVESVQKKRWVVDEDVSTGPPSDSRPSSAGPSTLATPRDASVSSSVTGVDEPSIVDTLLAAVANEAGCEISDFEPDTAFADLGVDSLMAITVIASIRNTTGVELPGSFFLDNPTVADAAKAIGEDTGETSAVSSAQPTSLDSPPTALSKNEESAAAEPLDYKKVLNRPECTDMETPSSKLVTNPPASVIMLQGSKSSTDIPLFLLADGTGSVSTYVQLLPLAGGRRVYGLESPFARDSSSFGSCRVEELADSFATAIRAAQPTGPYILGGFLIGAIYAFEVSKRLLAAGETVLGLLLVASPAPTPAPPALQATTVSVELVEHAGLVSGPGCKQSTMSRRQKEHLAAAIQSLLKYTPRGMISGRQPRKTILLMASKGLGEGSNTLDSPLTPWIHANWGISEALGWESLIESVDVALLETDCFSLMKHPQVCRLLTPPLSIES